MKVGYQAKASEAMVAHLFLDRFESANRSHGLGIHRLKMKLRPGCQNARS